MGAPSEIASARSDPSRGCRPNNVAKEEQAHRGLAGVLGRPRFAHNGDLDLTRVLHSLLDLLADIASDSHGFEVVDDFWANDDSDLAAGLDGERALDALVAFCDVLQRLKPLDVGLERLAACAGASSGGTGIIGRRAR